MTLTWYKVPLVVVPMGLPGLYSYDPDYISTEPYFASQIDGTYLAVLTEQVIAFPTMTNAEVAALGIDPNRGIAS